MKKVAKLIIIDGDGRYLLMYRSDHPVFGRDPDLPGGTLEVGESTLETMLREVDEEIGVVVDPTLVRELYQGTEYSKHGTHYALYSIVMKVAPEITMSWEHSRYEWLSEAEFLRQSSAAKDTYMHMAADIVSKNK